MNTKRRYECPVDATISLIGGKYKVIILYHLIPECLRFGELKKLLPNATPKMLTQQLRELESDGFISRTIYPVVPPKTEYQLTEFGKTLIPVLELMCEWGKTHIDDFQ